MLTQIHREAPPLTDGERWHLRYLDAWQAAFQGNYADAEIRLREVIAHSGDMTLIAKATALLMSNLGLNRRYEEAFVLASRLVADLPRIKDKLARFAALANLSQVLISAGQNDLALKYARMMENDLPPGETLCNPLSQQVAALYNAKRLASASPELRRAIDACRVAGQPVFANAMWLVLANLYLDEGEPGRALALLDRLAPGIQANHYYPHMLSSQVLRAQAYWKLGDDGKARKTALAAIATSSPDDVSEWLREAYLVLYRIEKRHGNARAALEYYEHYVAQDKGYLNDVSARALAYQVVQQQMLAKKLETDALAKQNSILRLQRALDTKAVETGRLYILLLLVALASIVLWLLRLKRSQLRFMKLASYDGLTGIFNHQHFISIADAALRQSEKKLVPLCLVAIDLDHFKRVNDTYGHVMGDVVLRRVVEVCQRHLRPNDLFGRLGGEEFGILLLDCSREQGVAIADRIRVAIQASPVEENECTVAISASIGFACTDGCGYRVQRLYQEADAALYRAKRAGRNRLVSDRDGDGTRPELPGDAADALNAHAQGPGRGMLSDL